jgi:hypothetical protein
MRLHPWKEGKWPYLLSEGYEIKSPETWDYNCIAYAADVDWQWWWPDQDGDAFWPEGVRREETLDCFVEAYKTLGYEVCECGLEPGFEKIAIYARHGIPTHAAKQLPMDVGKANWGPGKILNTTRSRRSKNIFTGKRY